MRAFAKHRFVVVDVETTGTSHAMGDRVTEVAAVLLEGGEMTDGFHSLINPGRIIPARITALTGISNAMVARAPAFADVAAKVARVLKGRIFVAHNAAFDWGFLSMEFTRAGCVDALPGAPLCTVRLARRVLAHLPRRNLDACALHYGVDIENRHRALGDARATAVVLQGLLHDAERQGVNTIESLHKWMARSSAVRRRSALPRWAPDSGLGDGA